VSPCHVMSCLISCGVDLLVQCVCVCVCKKRNRGESLDTIIETGKFHIFYASILLVGICFY